MSPLWLRILQHVHGPLGWLAALALVHPALLLRARRRADLATSLATGLATIAVGLGAYVYPHYRVRVKQKLFLEMPTMGWMFERKEHLAVAAVAFAWVGLILYRLGREGGSPGLQRGAHRAYVAAAVCAVVTAVLGTAVAAVRSL